MTPSDDHRLDGRGLPALEARLREDLIFLCHPGKDWVPPREGASDVVIIGGGMCGMVAWLGLRTGGLRRVRVLDRSAPGREGPWVTYARMETLRSPKTLTGPAFGHGALTFQAWYRAQFGVASWNALDKIPRPMWMDYLRWYRKVLELPVENEVEVTRIAPLEDHLLKLELSGAGAREPFVLARKVVLATGREGLGYPTIPAFVDGLPRERWAHSADAIDFAALKDKRVVVIGIGASAVDNSAEALEAGASEVRHLIRRAEMPRINKMMGIGSFGFSAGFPHLDDAWRWRFMNYSCQTQTPPPRGSTLRVSRHANAYFHFNSGIESMRFDNGELVIDTQRGRRFHTDFVILATGFTVDPVARTELAEYVDNILLWRDRYTPPAQLENDELGRFPYLAPNFAFQERQPGRSPWLQHIHCFNYAANLSLGKVSGDIPAVSEGAGMLVQSLAADFYHSDIEQHWQRLLDHSKPELLGDEWRDSDAEEQ
jgi:cation diffusion facilitator CzcD-associated flavoprotein CzcO